MASQEQPANPGLLTVGLIAWNGTRIHTSCWSIFFPLYSRKLRPGDREQLTEAQVEQDLTSPDPSPGVSRWGLEVTQGAIRGVKLNWISTGFLVRKLSRQYAGDCLRTHFSGKSGVLESRTESVWRERAPPPAQWCLAGFRLPPPGWTEDLTRAGGPGALKPPASRWMGKKDSIVFF